MASIKGQTCATNNWVCSVTSGDCPNVWLARLLKVFYSNFWLIQTKRKSNIDYPLWVLTTPIIDWLLLTCLGTFEVLGKSLAIGFWIQMSDFKPKSVVVKFFHPIDRTYIRLQDPNIANSAKVTYEIKSTVWPKELARSKDSFLLKSNLDGFWGHSGANKTFGPSQLFWPHCNFLHFYRHVNFDILG